MKNLEDTEDTGDVVLEGTQPTRTPSLMRPTASLEVLKTTFSFAHSLGRLTELTESCYNYSYGLSQRKNANYNQPGEEVSRKRIRMLG